MAVLTQLIQSNQNIPGDEKESWDKNWAEDPAVRERIKKEIVPMIQIIKDRRKPLEELWRKLFKVWTMEHQEQGYRGDSDVYIPAGKKIMETLTSQLVSSTFPVADPFGVEPAELPSTAEEANFKQAILKHQIEKVAKVRNGADAFYRQLLSIGISPVKVHYRKKELNQLRKKKSKDNVIQLLEHKRLLYDGPVFDVLDAHKVFVFPENATRYEDLEIIFEELTVSIGTLRAGVRAGTYLKSEVDAVSNSLRGETQSRADNDRMESQGIQSPHDVTVSGWGGVDVSEVWLEFDPTATDRESEENPVPFVITVTSGGHVLRASRNPYNCQMCPILFGRMGTYVNRFYGTGVLETIFPLQILLNDQVNQTMDCASYALSPIFLTNPDYIMGAFPDLEPGMNIPTRDVNLAVKTIVPPMEPLSQGSVLISQTQQWMNDFSGAPPVLQGGAAPGRAQRTATGIGTAQRNASIPLQEIVRLCEGEVWEPMLMLFDAYNEQYLSESTALLFSGGLELPPPNEAGVSNMKFRWLASTQSDNKVVKGQQLMECITLVTTPNVATNLMQNGKVVDVTPLVKRLYQEVYGYRDIESVVKPAPPPVVPGMPPGGVPGGMPPEDGAVPPGSPQGSIPELSDNQEFEGMRGEADALSSLLGSSNMDMGGGGM